jgi:hypothetical protein
MDFGPGVTPSVAQVIERAPRHVVDAFFDPFGERGQPYSRYRVTILNTLAGAPALAKTDSFVLREVRYDGLPTIFEVGKRHLFFASRNVDATYSADYPCAAFGLDGPRVTEPFGRLPRYLRGVRPGDMVSDVRRSLGAARPTAPPGR